MRQFNVAIAPRRSDQPETFSAACRRHPFAFCLLACADTKTRRAGKIALHFNRIQITAWCIRGKCDFSDVPRRLFTLPPRIPAVSHNYTFCPRRICRIAWGRGLINTPRQWFHAPPFSFSSLLFLIQPVRIGKSIFRAPSVASVFSKSEILWMPTYIFRCNKILLRSMTMNIDCNSVVSRRGM